MAIFTLIWIHFVSIPDQSPVRSSHEQCWVPIVANQFPAVSPFTIVEEETPVDSITSSKPSTSKCVHSRTSSLKSRNFSSSMERSGFTSSSQVTLFPVMVPLLAAPGSVSTKRQREVKFDETILWHEQSCSKWTGVILLAQFPDKGKLLVSGIYSKFMAGDVLFLNVLVRSITYYSDHFFFLFDFYFCFE